VIVRDLQEVSKMLAIALQGAAGFCEFPECQSVSRRRGSLNPSSPPLKTKAPQGDQCLHEIKYDGYRVQVHVSSGRKKVYTGNRLDWTKRFSAFGVEGQPRENPSYAKNERK